MLTRTFQVVVSQGDIDLSPGVYVLGIYGVDYEGHYKRKHLEAFAWCLDSSSSVPASDAGALLSAVISDSDDLEHALRVPKEELQRALDCMELARHERLETRRQELQGEERILIKQRSEQINYRAERERDRRENAIEALKMREQSANIKNLIRANEVQIEKSESARRQRLAELPDEPVVRVSWDLKSLGLVKVQ